MIKFRFLCAALIFLPLALFAQGTTVIVGDAPPEPPNVLFIAIDDLRPEIGAYGVSQIQTPRMDELASRGVVFDRAYVQVALCNPSRASLLTGLRPDALGIYGLGEHIRDNNPDVITLPQWFKMNGYESRGLNKIFHVGNDDQASWSEPAEFQHPIHESKEARSAKPAWSGTSGDPQENNRDYQVATRSVELIGELSQNEKPFFLAVGFFLPHLPWIAPQEYFDLYADAPLAPFPPRSMPLNRPADPGVPGVGHEFWQYNKDKNWVSEANNTPDAVRAYYACTTFVDHLVGRLIDALEANGVADNTIIVLWGDHGWHLGEQNGWGKIRSNFEIAARAPLIIYAPGYAQDAHVTGLVEFVDIYPTLAELASLPLPDHLQGTSLLPQMKSPSTPAREAAFSQQQTHHSNPGMGYSVRTEDYRYTEWRFNDGRVVRELYDLSAGNLEESNIAEKPEMAEVVQQHAEILNNAIAEW